MYGTERDGQPQGEWMQPGRGCHAPPELVPE